MKNPRDSQWRVRRASGLDALLLAVTLGLGAAVVMAEPPVATQPAEKTVEAKPVAPATTQPSATQTPTGDGKHQAVSFNELAGFRLKLKYTMNETGERLITPGSINPQIPANVKDLNGKKVAVRGYLLPIEFDGGTSTRFILMRFTPDCLYCSSPSLVDWVDASSKEGVALPQNAQTPVEVTGTLGVGERLEDGMITSIYQMKVDAVTVVKPEVMREGQPGGVAPVAPGHVGVKAQGRMGE
jgi:hypothetical protein